MQYRHTLFTAQHSTAQHSTAQHSTAQHSTAQHDNSVIFGFISSSDRHAGELYALLHGVFLLK